MSSVIKPDILAQAKAATDPILDPEAAGKAIDQRYAEELKEGGPDQALRKSVYKDDVEAAERYLGKYNTNPNILMNPDSNQQSDLDPLISIATNHGNSPMIDLLLKYNANIESRDSFHSTPLWTALNLAGHDNHDSTVLTLLDHHADVVHSDPGYDAGLHIAARVSSVKVLQRVLDEGVSSIINSPGQSGEPPLLIAVGTLASNAQPADEKRIQDKSELLIQYGADPDVGSTQKNQWTSLHEAAMKGDENLVNLLLENPYHKANPAVITKQVTRSGGETGPEVPAPGMTSLMAAASARPDLLAHHNLRIADKLLSYPEVDVNATDKNGKTALMYAAQAGNDLMVEFLLSKGADKTVNAIDKSNRTALDYAGGLGVDGAEPSPAAQAIINFKNGVVPHNRVGEEPLPVDLSAVPEPDAQSKLHAPVMQLPAGSKLAVEADSQQLQSPDIAYSHAGMHLSVVQRG